jgi:hypothetical protein
MLRSHATVSVAPLTGITDEQTSDCTSSANAYLLIQIQIFAAPFRLWKQIAYWALDPDRTNPLSEHDEALRNLRLTIVASKLWDSELWWLRTSYVFRCVAKLDSGDMARQWAVYRANRKNLETAENTGGAAGGYKDVTTTVIYTHVLNEPGFGVRSPLDR